MLNLQFVILAAGKGTRMNEGEESPIPKVLYQIGGRPMICYILDTIKTITNKIPNNKSQISNKFQITNSQNSNNLAIQQCNSVTILQPIIVVGYKSEEVIKELGSNYIYVVQEERLGTGHAAKIGLSIIRANPHVNGSRSASICVDDVFILQGDDSAFYTKEMLIEAIKRHQDEDAVLSFLTTKIPGLDNYGKILRNDKGEITGVVEKENMTQEQKKLDEINCGAYLMDLTWAKKNIPLIKQHHIGNTEYPLPDVIKMAVRQKQKVLGIQISPDEWVGINSPDQLERAERLMQFRTTSR